MLTDLERDFAAWADRRDPDSLTRVFDATAGRLLLLAAHVAGPHATAEDLVQATFLAAMKRTATWDRSRPVWPWLAAILQNQARMEWRRRRRRREVGIGEALEAPTSQDPAHIAASDDAFQAIVGAIEQLPRQYRQVLLLRLVHGLAQVEIARALEMPVGTVRARVHRGLARLRQALPPGVTALAVGAMLASEGSLWSQVRVRVLEQAGVIKTVAAASTTAWPWIGGLTMKAKTIVLSALCVTLLALVGVLVLPPILDAGEQSDPPVSSLMAGAKTASPAPSKPDDASLRRTRLQAEPVPAWPLVALVRAPGGAPIGGAHVEVSVAPDGAAGRIDGLREVLAVGETGADGRFRCDLDELRTRSALFRRMSQLRVLAECESRGTRRTVLALPRQTGPERFDAELVLAATIDLVGRVIDESRAPVAGARLYSISADDTQVSALWQHTTADGAFRIPVDPEDFDSRPGHLAASSPALGTGAVPLPDLEKPPPVGSAIDCGTISLARRASIRGRVVLGDGAGLGGFPVAVIRPGPWAGAEVEDDPQAIVRAFQRLGSPQKRDRFASGRLCRSLIRTVTAADGSFTISGLEPQAACAVAVRDTCMRPIATMARAGGAPVRLVVDRQLLLVDVRGASGEVLPGAGVLAEGFDPALDLLPRRVRPGFPAQYPFVTARFYPADALGRRMLLSPFGWTWRVGPFDEVARPDFLRHHVFPGAHRAELHLVLRAETRFGSVRLEVLDEDGEPFEPFDIELRALDREASRHTSSLSLSRGDTISDLPAGRWQLSVHLGQKASYFTDVWMRGSQVHEIPVEDAHTTELRIEAPRAGLVAFRPHSDTPPRGGAWQGLTIRAEKDPTRSAIEICVYRPTRPGADRLGADSRRYGELFVAKQPFPPGKHAFLVEAEGYLTARCDVEVEPDRMLKVPVKLRHR